MVDPPKPHHFHLPSLLANHLTRQVKELYLSVGIIDFAVATVAIFEPIYLYVLGFSLRQILLFFLSVYLIFFFTLPLGAKVARTKGYEHSILYSTPFSICYWFSLYAIPISSFFILTAIISLVLEKTFYWPGYHADLARFSRREERGREISNLMIISSISYVLGPLFGGVILSLFGFQVLFIVVSLLILFSNVPLFSTREVFTPIPFSYREAYRDLLKRENRRKFFAYFGFGEELIQVVLWPIFIYLVIKKYFSIGLVVALGTFLTSLTILYIGRLTDIKNKHLILKTGSIFSSLSWILRLLAQGVLGVFLVDTFARMTKGIVGIPLTTITYERATRSSVMRSVVFFEMSLVIGKITAIILSLVAISLWSLNPWPALFFLGAGFALLYGVL